MPTFEESGLKFSFDKQWRVFKFDRHRFYRYVSGYGLKGVDFLGLDPEEDRLLLIEVKNFAPDDWPGQSPNLPTILEQPEPYAEEMAQKFLDSFQLIRVIGQFYQKKWWLRQFGGIIENWLPNALAVRLDYYLWTRAGYLLHHYPERVQLVLWLELEESLGENSRNGFYDHLNDFLKNYFAAQGFQFTLANQQFPAVGQGFSIGK